MADFVAVLRKTLDGLTDPTPETRQRVYERARATIVARIEAMTPPPPPSVREMQMRALDDAIKTVEQGYAPRKPLDPLDELEDVFRSLNGLMNQPTTPAPKPAAAVVPPRPPVADTRTPSTPRQPIAERPPLTERPRVEPLPRREVPPLAESQRPVIPPRPVTPPARPAADVRAVPPQLPPVRDPSRPLPGQNRPAAAPVRETLRTPPPGDDFDDFNLDAAAGAPDDFGLPPVAEVRRPVEPPRRAVPAAPEPQRSGGGFGKIAAVVLGLAALGGAAYGVWINKDDFSRLVGLNQPAETQPVVPATPTPTPEPEQVAAAPATEEPAVEPEAAAPDATPPKLTQRLNEDGTEVDSGPAAGEPAIGEGTSIAAITQPSDVTPPAAPATETPTPPVADAAPADPAAATPADPAATPAEPATPADATPATPAPADVAMAPAQTDPPAAPADPAATPADPAAPAEANPPAAAPPATAGDQNVAVAQKAIFYEERTASSQGSAEQGTTIWSVAQESPGAGQPAEPAIKAVVSIPGRDVGLSMTIRRNTDPTLPASHIIEMIFITPEGFSEGSVDNILRVALKSDEQQPGSPVIGLPAKIGDGFFLVALNNSKAEIDANMNLLRRQNWIDIAVVYKSGRRALITMEKGVPGEKVFDDVLKSWGVQTAG